MESKKPWGTRLTLSIKGLATARPANRDEKTWGMRIALAVDQMGNVLAKGREDETISSRCGRIIRENENVPRCRLCRMLCWMLDKLDKNHCDDAVEKWTQQK